jgi:hypothetical protein
VILPSLLAAQADGRRWFDVEGTTLEDALRALPVADLVFDERGAWRPHLNVYVDGTDARDGDGLACPLASAREVRIVAMLSGG